MIIKGFIMTLGMFSIIPVPKNSWNDECMPLLIPSLPVVGALIGFIWYGSALLLSQTSLSLMIRSAIILFIPLILSGFLHMDGYMDTADAVLSRRDLPEKKRILKDPYVGAFSIFAAAVLIVFQFSAVHTILEEHRNLSVIAFIPVISRCIVGIAMINLKPAFETGYNASFRKGAKPRHTLFICILAAICISLAWLHPGISLLPLLIELFAGILVTIYLYRQFNGISGDLCGCIITVSEFAAILFISC